MFNILTWLLSQTFKLFSYPCGLRNNVNMFVSNPPVNRKLDQLLACLTCRVAKNVAGIWEVPKFAPL